MRIVDLPPGSAGLEVDAWRCAQVAADRHRIRVVELHDIAEHHAAAALLARIWRTQSPDSVVNAGLIRAFEHSGNYVVGAYDGTALIGTAIGFLGAGHLHSHVTGVDPARQGAGVGFALKAHQRAWALHRGIPDVCWTFDPLVRRNAYFNLHKLGAQATAYLPDFYGPMTDGINAGDATDRLYATWRLASPRSVAAAHGDPADVDTAALRAAGACALVDRAGVVPVDAGEDPPADGRPVLVAVPLDVEALRVDDETLSRRWRAAVRAALTAALAAGYRITGMARDGFYVLEIDS